MSSETEHRDENIEELSDLSEAAGAEAAGPPDVAAAPPPVPAGPPPAPAVPPPTEEAALESHAGPPHETGPAALPEGLSPEVANADLSAIYGDDDLGAAALMGDDEAVKKINRRTSPFGRIVAFLMVGVVVTAGGLYYMQHQKSVEMQAKIDAIAAMENEEEVVAALRNLYKETGNNSEEQWRVVKNLGHFRDTASVPTFVEALEVPGRVRRAAAWSLARIGSPGADTAKPTLLKVLPETDERDRAQVVWTLAVLGEPKAADAIIDQFSRGLLQNLDGFDAKVITGVLGPARLGSEDLINHQNESVRRLTAHALAEAASPEVVDPLSRLIQGELARKGDDRSEEVIRAAAAGLGRSGDPRAARPLFEILKKQPNLTQAVLDALRSSTGAPELATLVKEAHEPAIKRDLTRLLAATHDPRGADALAKLTGSDDAEIKATAAIALAEIEDARAAPTLVEIVRGEDETLGDRALDALKYVASGEILPDLRDMLENMPHRKATILRVMAATGDQGAGSAIEKELDGDDVSAAALSLAELDYDPAYDKLLKLVTRPKDVDMYASNAAERSLTNEDLLRKRKAAILAMGRYTRPDAFEALSVVVEDDAKDDYELRALAAHSIGQLATAEQLRTVLAKIKDDTLNEEARRYYVQALWQRPHPELGNELVAMIGDTNVPIPVRRAAALAVGYTADPAHDAKLMEMLDSEDARRHAAMAVVLGGSEEAVKKLVATLSKDNDTREILQEALLNDQNDWFNILTAPMLEGEQVYRRLRAADIMRQGDEEQSFGYAWAKIVSVLRSGWGGADGVRPHAIRMKLFEVLTNPATKPERRTLIVEALASIPERGLLLRARDEGGKAAEAVHELLRAKIKKGPGA